MVSLRRPDHSPRLELTPLIDVIFLLLTFFIYNLIIAVPMKELPVRIASGTQGTTAGAGDVRWVRIDKQGRLFYREKGTEQAVTGDELDVFFASLSKDPTEPTLFLQIDARGDIDRAPLVVNLFERIRKAGLKNVTFVGQSGQEIPRDDAKNR
ncbi:MAG: biopolymer transporter ExbD [Phycisphaeraceae bacterium]